MPALCREGMTLAVASDDELADLRAALEPVYDELATDPTTGQFIDKITELKTDLAAPPEAPECDPADTGAPPESAFLEGVALR